MRPPANTPLIHLDPSNAKARFNLGNIFDDRREYQAARILFRDAAALNPDFADAHFNLALACEQLGLVEGGAGPLAALSRARTDW